MNIVLSIGAKYVRPSLVCLISILENNKNPIDFYILYAQLADREIEFLRNNIKKYGDQHSLILVPIKPDIFSGSPLHGRSPEAYFRLLIPSVLPAGLSRCLYLDGDTIVNKSLAGFYDLSFDDQALIVCEDIGEVLFYHQERHPVLNIPLSYRYFNSGVLLFNLAYFQQHPSRDLILNYFRNNSAQLKFLDQDVLNALFYDRVKFVNSSLYDYLEIVVNPLLTNDNLSKAVIIHFLQKPWRYDYNGINAKYWWQYGRKIAKLAYWKFCLANFIYKKCLGFALLFISVERLKKIKGQRPR